MKKERVYLKTHNYKILKEYTIEEILAHGEASFFMDEDVTEWKIWLRRIHILNKIGYDCVEKGCDIKGTHFAVGEDNGGGIHIDLYGYDEDGELHMITIDHIKPKSKGGKNHISNYQPMCMICNSTKADDYDET